jgi:hypothetical protein
MVLCFTVLTHNARAARGTGFRVYGAQVERVVHVARFTLSSALTRFCTTRRSRFSPSLALALLSCTYDAPYLSWVPNPFPIRVRKIAFLKPPFFLQLRHLWTTPLLNCSPAMREAGARQACEETKDAQTRSTAAGRRSTWVQTSARSTVSQSAHLRPIARLARRPPKSSQSDCEEKVHRLRTLRLTLRSCGVLAKRFRVQYSPYSLISVFACHSQAAISEGDARRVAGKQPRHVGNGGEAGPGG